MTTEDNIALVRRYLDEVWAKGNLDALDNLLSPHYQRHLNPNSPPLTRDGQRQRLNAFRGAFPDVQLTMEDIFAEGDRVVFRSTMRATHRGTFLGIPPTGNRVCVALLDVVRLDGGKFAEHWGGPDMLDLLKQLGASVQV